MRRLLALAFLALFATSVSSSGITNQSSPEEIVTTLKQRNDVVLAAKRGIMLQFTFPPQYALCLYAAYTQARHENSVAHDFLLTQIDLLYSAGLSATDISGLIAYGNALSTNDYATSSGRPLDKLDATDFANMQAATLRTLVKHSCVKTFGGSKVQSAIRDLARSALSPSD